MKAGVLSPARLVDISRLPLREVRRDGKALMVGSLTTMSELTYHPTVVERLPLVRDALLQSASPQLRNMATLGGNLLQRTRCHYFRDPTVACNKRDPGSGCSALAGFHRAHAILGTSEQCFATHASDVAVALIALDTLVHIQGSAARVVPLADIYRVPADTPQVENVLAQGDLITRLEIPLLPTGARSSYLKVRDRAGFEFALVSAAAAVVIRKGVIAESRIALGGVGTIPWRASAAERVLRGTVPSVRGFAEAADAALADAAPPAGERLQGRPCQTDDDPHPDNRFEGGLSTIGTWRTPYWCRAPSRPAGSGRSTPSQLKPRLASWP